MTDRLTNNGGPFRTLPERTPEEEAAYGALEREMHSADVSPEELTFILRSNLGGLRTLISTTRSRLEQARTEHIGDAELIRSSIRLIMQVKNEGGTIREIVAGTIPPPEDIMLGQTSHDLLRMVQSPQCSVSLNYITQAEAMNAGPLDIGGKMATLRTVDGQQYRADLSGDRLELTFTEGNNLSMNALHNYERLDSEVARIISDGTAVGMPATEWIELLGANSGSRGPKVTCGLTSYDLPVLVMRGKIVIEGLNMNVGNHVFLQHDVPHFELLVDNCGRKQGFAATAHDGRLYLSVENEWAKYLTTNPFTKIDEQV